MSEFRLVAAKKQKPHNVMKIISARAQDIGAWPQPVRLKRRPIEANNFEANISEESSDSKLAESSKGKNGVDTSVIAPYGGGARNKQNLFRKKTRQITLVDEQDRKTRNEESVPWRLDDADDQIGFVGSLEGGQQTCYVLFMFSVSRQCKGNLCLPALRSF